ncbi:MAG: methyltransferase [Geminicoccaceae bacterium]
MTRTTDEDAPAVTPDGIMQLGLGFWGAKTLLSAVELGLFGALAQGPATAEELQGRLGLHPRAARDFLDALAALGMLEREDGRYRNTPATARYLDPTRPGYIGGALEMAGARLYGFWGGLTDALRTGRPQNEARHGGDFFGALYADPARLEGFLKAMTGLSAPIAAAIARRFPWARHRTLIDVGCAQGGLPVTVAQAHPHLTGGGFDLPAVEPVFTAHVAAHGLADRLRFHPGDFQRDPLPAADALVMGHILHDWDLAQKRELLAKAHAALPPGGALIVYDMMIDDARRTNAAGLLMSLNMLIETPGGFDYTGADCIGWLRAAGFRDARVEPLGGAYSMAVGVK